MATWRDWLELLIWAFVVWGVFHLLSEYTDVFSQVH